MLASTNPSVPSSAAEAKEREWVEGLFAREIEIDQGTSPDRGRRSRHARSPDRASFGNVPADPNAQLAVIPDAGHFVQYEDLEKSLPIVATFLDHTSTVPFATTISGCQPGKTR